MLSRDILIAAIDLLLAFLIVFVLGFLAIRYDETKGPESEIVSLETLETSVDGDYESLNFLAIYLWENKIQFHEFQFGQWMELGPTFNWDWNDELVRELASNDLPVVIYEIERSTKLGDVYRLLVATGEPIGIAKVDLP